MDNTSRLYHEMIIQWNLDISNPDNSNSKYMIALNLEDWGDISDICFHNSFSKICCGYIKEPSHRDGSFNYPKHTFD